MCESYDSSIFSATITIISAFLGAIVGNHLAQRGTITNDYRMFLTKLYAEITAEYFRMLDGRSSRSGIVYVAKQALFLCSDDMKPYLNRLIQSVIYIKDIHNDDLSEFHGAYAAFESAAEIEVNRLWSASLFHKNKKQKKEMDKSHENRK